MSISRGRTLVGNSFGCNRLDGRVACEGRRVFFVLEIAVFVPGSVPAGMSRSMSQLVACRAVQGIGGGVIVITSMVAIADLFPPAQRGKFQG